MMNSEISGKNGLGVLQKVFIIRNELYKYLRTYSIWTTSEFFFFAVKEIEWFLCRAVFAKTN